MLSGLVILLAISVLSTAIDLPSCKPNENCSILCDSIDPINGCSNKVIDASQALSLSLVCSSSQQQYVGGCQFSSIYCPKINNSQCNIECNDYYGCYYTKIYSSYSNITTNNNVNIKCMDEEGSCYKTTLYANKSSSVSISCYGSGRLSSSSHSACNSFYIYIEHLTNNFNLLCSDDYSCFGIKLYGNKANYIHVHARGNMALSSSYIYAQNAKELALFCGSEESEFGCHNLYTFNPVYSSPGSPRTAITCQGHGCYDEMYFYSENGALDMDISLNGCGECDDATSCILNWYFYCDVLTFDTFHGDSCESSANCDCQYAVNTINAHTNNNFDQCDIFSFDYLCPSGKDCIIDCMQKWPNNGCYDKMISGDNATSLSVICNSTSNNPIYGACESSHIYCPSGDFSQCNIECENKDACYDTEISVVNNKHSTLNLTCINTDSCSHTNVYGASNADVNVNCIATDSCDNINVTAHYADNVTIHCEGDATYSSYSACDRFNIWAESVMNDVKLLCHGDYSCSGINVYANHSNNVIIETIGIAGHHSNIYASNAESMMISCRSEVSHYNYDAFTFHFYIPEKATSIDCEGYGCYYMNLYAPNGFSDITKFQMNGCTECSSVYDCVSGWNVYCGAAYSTYSRWYGSSSCSYSSCGCISSALYMNGWSNTATTQCDLFMPDHDCIDGEICNVDCSDDNECKQDTIFGNNASSLTVDCGYYGCSNANIYCPASYHSQCNIICDGYESCYGAKIYTEPDTIFNISCSGREGCGDTEIHIENVYKSQFACTGQQTCDSMTIHGDNAGSVTMNCIGNSINGGYIYAQNSSNLSIYLITPGNDQYGAENVRIYIPPKQKTNLNCIGYGCHDIIIYAINGMKDINNIDIHGCDYCMSLEECIGSWGLYCGSSYFTSTSLHNNACNDDSCDCHDLKAKLEESWSFHSFGIDALQNDEQCVANWTADFECAANTSCTMNCDYTKCKSKSIWGHKASSLTVNCDYSYGCQYIDVYCPEGANTPCNINCGGDYSCSYARIYGDKTSKINIKSTSTHSFQHSLVYAYNSDSVNLDCSHSYSCGYSTVYASEANDVNIGCSGSASASYSDDSPCYNLKIYAAFANNVNLICSDQYSCYYSYLHADNAHNVTVLGDNGHFTMYNAYIYADNALYFELTCIGEVSGYGCYYGSFYLPKKEKTNINCYGYGCSYIHTYISDGMTSLSSSNIMINSCGTCSSLYYCASSWTVTCDEWSSYDVSTALKNGVTCSNTYCDCSSHTDLLSNGYVMNLNDDGCEAIKGPTDKPTIYPTVKPTIYPTVKPTIYPTVKPTDDPTSNRAGNDTKDSHDTIEINKITLFIIIISVVISLCIIGYVIYCIKCRARNKIPHEKLQIEEGLAEIALQPIPQHIRQQIEMQRKDKHENDENLPQGNQTYVKLEEDGGDGTTSGGVTGVSAYSVASQ